MGVGNKEGDAQIFRTKEQPSLGPNEELQRTAGAEQTDTVQQNLTENEHHPEQPSGYSYVHADGRKATVGSEKEVFSERGGCPFLADLYKSNPDQAKALMRLSSIATEQTLKDEPSKPEADKKMLPEDNKKPEKVAVAKSDSAKKSSEPPSRPQIEQPIVKELDLKDERSVLVQDKKHNISLKPEAQPVQSEQPVVVNNESLMLVEEQLRAEEQNRLDKATKLAEKATRQPELTESTGRVLETEEPAEQKTEPLAVYQEYTPPNIREEQSEASPQQTNNSLSEVADMPFKEIVQKLDYNYAGQLEVATESTDLDKGHGLEQPIKLTPDQLESIDVDPDEEVIIEHSQAGEAVEGTEPEIMDHNPDTDVDIDEETSYYAIETDDFDQYRESAMSELHLDNTDSFIADDELATEQSFVEPAKGSMEDIQVQNLEQAMNQIVQDFGLPEYQPEPNSQLDDDLAESVVAEQTVEVNPIDQAKAEEVRVVLRDIAAQIKEFTVEDEISEQSYTELKPIIIQKLSELLNDLGYEFSEKSLEKVVDARGLEYLVEVIDQTYSKISPDARPEVTTSAHKTSNLYQDLQLIKDLFRLAFSGAPSDIKGT